MFRNSVPRALALLAISTAPFSTLHSQQQTPVKALTAEEWRADLRFLMTEMRARHKNLYHTTPKAVLDSAASSLDSRIPTLSRHEIIAEMMKIVAMVGDGHTNIYPTRDRVIDFHTLPISLYLFKDGWYVRAADSAHSDIVGTRVVRIGNATIDDAYERMKPYIGRDNEMGARFWAAYLLAIPEMLHAARISDNSDSAQFELDIRGKRRTVWLRSSGAIPVTPADTDMSWWRRAGWVDARDANGRKDPLWLSKRPDSTFFWFEIIPGTRTGYAQINQVRNAPDEPLAGFTDRLLQFSDTAQIDKLIIDLRLNRGGNGNLIKPLEKGLVKRPKVNSRGRLYVLMGRSTWSASQFFLNDMSQFSEATFVGEPSGSRGNAYGDSRQIKLPNSGITARASIYYWQDWHPEDPRKWIAPDIAAEMTFDDYASNRDPALAAAMKDAGGPTMREQMQTLVASNDTVRARRQFLDYRASPEHSYIDGHVLLDDVAVHFYDRKDLPHATWVFALAANQYPQSARAQLNHAAMLQNTGNKVAEAAALRRVLALEPANAAALERLKVLDGK